MIVMRILFIQGMITNPMANVLDAYEVHELDGLQSLADDLEEILLTIAYDNKAGDREYVESSLRYLEERYGRLVSMLEADITTNPYTAKSNLGTAIASVISAYGRLEWIQRLQTDMADESKHGIEEEARDGVYEYLILPDRVAA